MSLASVLHRLGQMERDLRHELDPPDPDAPRCDLSFATLEELDLMEAALLAEDAAEVARLVGVVNDRIEKGEEPVWTPAVTPELVEATATARAEGRDVIPVTDDVYVELAFPLHDVDEPDEEPEPEPLATSLEAPAPEPVVERPQPAPAPAHPAAVQRPLSMVERAHVSGRRKRWYGDEESGVAGILEREF